MLIYSPEISPRLTYVLNYLFKERFGINYTLESDIEKFKADKGLRLNYSSEPIENVFQILPSTLLFESGINELKPEVTYAHKTIHFFASDQGNLGFDIFSACFWMLTRYEEHQSFQADEHNRFTAKESLAYKYEFIKRPLVDEWLMEFKDSLTNYYGSLQFKNEQYSVLPTIDIDSPWCYKNKGIVRNIGGFFRDCLKVNLEEIPERLKVLLQFKEDAHFQFNWLNDLYKRLNLKPVYFILIGKYGKYDKTIDANNKQFKSFVSDLARNAELGIHPSYAASDNKEILLMEIAELNDISGKTISKSRQHFLKFSLPNYYEQLQEAGIMEDYSMGFADYIGFRAGTSRSFKFYNLNKDEETDLRIYPFSVMDVTLQQYMNKNPQEALVELEDIIENIKKVNGNFVSLWHNESLSERMEWKGWKEVYTEMLKIALI